MNKTFTKKQIEKSLADQTEREENKMELCTEPKAEVIKNILDFSKALSVKKSKHLKHVEIILN